VNDSRHAAGIGKKCAPREGSVTSALRQFFCSCSCCRYHVVELGRVLGGPLFIQRPQSGTGCPRRSNIGPLARAGSSPLVEDGARPYGSIGCSSASVHDGVAITARSSGAPRRLEWADLAEVLLRLDRYPQRLPVDFLPLRDHPCARRTRGGPRFAHSSRDKKVFCSPSSAALRPSGAVRSPPA
jgi:hypothetical protein